MIYNLMDEDQWQKRMSFICDSLWVSEVACRAHTEGLRRVGIDTVISILTKEQQAEWDVRAPVHQIKQPVAPMHEKTVTVPAHHTFHFADGDYIDPEQMYDILGLFGETTLLHCISGANRSSAVAICYLLLKKQLDPIEACHMYWTQRGRSTANVYGSVPRMAQGMLTSVVDFYTRFVVDRKALDDLGEIVGEGE